MDILEKARLKLEAQNKPITPIKIKALNPPKTPTKEIIPEGEFFIDFNKIANNSSFQRFLVEAIKMSVPQLKGISARTTKEVMNKAFSTQINKIDKAVNVYNEIESLPSELLKELKSRLSEEKYGLIDSNQI